MKDGFSDCFPDKESAKKFADKLVSVGAKDRPHSDFEVCVGKSPFGDEVPYPWCVNHRWDVPGYDSKISHEWDEWRVKHSDEIGFSDDSYAGPDRIVEFDETFMFKDCQKVNKVV